MGRLALTLTLILTLTLTLTRTVTVGTLALLFLAAVFSIVVFDPDESEELQPLAAGKGLRARLPTRWRGGAKKAHAQAAAQEQLQRSRQVARELAGEEEDGAAAPTAAVPVAAAAAGNGRGVLWHRPAGQRARRGSRAVKQTSSRARSGSGAAAAGGATAAPNGGGGDVKTIVPPPPQRAKRGPTEADARMSDAQIAEYYDVVTAGGGATARRRLSGNGRM